MKLSGTGNSRQTASALVAVMVLGTMLTLIMLVSSQRSQVLKRELNILESRQKARLEKAGGPVNTNLINHGQGAHH